MSTTTLVALNSKGVTPLLQKQEEFIPSVFYTAEVIRAIDYIIHSMNKEVAWMGLVEKLEDNNYLIYKLYIPNQTVTTTTVNIDADAIAKLTMQILDEGLNPEHLRYHGHSHVNMTTHPSSVDQKHMEDYLEHSPYFIREIRNKKDEKRVDIFDKVENKIYHCVTTDIYDLMQNEDFYNALDLDFKSKIKDHVVIYPKNKLSPKLNNFNMAIPEVIYDSRIDAHNLEEVITYEELLSNPFYASGV